MNEFVLARVLHVLGVVLWIGGVAMVTTVLLPSVRRMKTPEERVAFFEAVERDLLAENTFLNWLRAQFFPSTRD